MLRKDAIKNKLTFAIVPNNQLESVIRNIPLRVVEAVAAREREQEQESVAIWCV